MPGRFDACLTERLEAYRRVLESARAVVAMLEAGSLDGLDEAQHVRQEAMGRVDALPPLPEAQRDAFRRAAMPVLEETRELDRQASALLHGARAKLLAEAQAMAPAPSRSPHQYGDIPQSARYVDLTR